MYSTVRDIELALTLLSVTDHQGLLRAASRRIKGTAYRDPADLVLDAISTAVLAAQGQGGRRWKKAVPFQAYLFNTIRGMASDARRTGRAHPTLTGCFGPEDQTGFAGLSTPSVEDEHVREEERQAQEWQEAARLDEILTQFRGDEEVQWIIRGIQEDLSAREIIERSGMTRTQYETARRRWRRGRG